MPPPPSLCFLNECEQDIPLRYHKPFDKLHSIHSATGLRSSTGTPRPERAPSRQHLRRGGNLQEGAADCTLPDWSRQTTGPAKGGFPVCHVARLFTPYLAADEGGHSWSCSTTFEYFGERVPGGGGEEIERFILIAAPMQLSFPPGHGALSTGTPPPEKQVVQSKVTL